MSGITTNRPVVSGKTYTTGKLARTAGVNLQTIRYYERSGLLPAPERDESGYRQYDESALLRLQFIRKAQTLGFTLKEIQQLLMLRESGEKSCRDVESLVRDRIHAVEVQINDLQKIHSFLNEMVEQCDPKQPANRCHFIREVDKRDTLVELQSAG